MRVGSRNPSHTLHLQPGEYVAAPFSEMNFSDTDDTDEARTLESRYRYWSCYYVRSSPGGIGSF